MAAEVPVSDVLCEAMEYLSKLGSNLRSRSDNLKEKRIRKDKLKNSHAIQKAAQKVLLICELSKKSLDNVEIGVRKILSHVKASQASTADGGKASTQVPDHTRFQYFEFKNSKLKVSKKIPLKHFLSSKVLVKPIPKAMLDKYPIYYACNLYRIRKRMEYNSAASADTIMSENKEEINSVNISTNQCNENSINKIDTISEFTTGNSKESNLENSVINLDEEDDCLNHSKRNETTSKCVDETDKKDVLSINKREKENIGDSTKTKERETISENNIASGERIKHPRISSERKRDHRNSTEIKKDGEKRESAKKKYRNIRTIDSSSDSDKEKDLDQVEDNKNSNENNIGNEENETCDTRPVCNEEIQKNFNNEDSQDSKNNEENNEKQHSKPLIKCVSITKLLKPEVLHSVVNKIESKNKVNKAIKSNRYDDKYSKKHSSNENESVCPKSDEERLRLEEEYWKEKRKEVSSFKSKPFIVKVDRLPELSKTYLESHNLKRIIQGSIVLFKIQDQTEKLIDSDTFKNLKSSLLNDSDSDNQDNVSNKEVNNAKHALLDESDSDLDKNNSDLKTNTCNDKNKDSGKEDTCKENEHNNESSKSNKCHNEQSDDKSDHSNNENGTIFNDNARVDSELEKLPENIEDTSKRKSENEQTSVQNDELEKGQEPIRYGSEIEGSSQNSDSSSKVTEKRKKRKKRKHTGERESMQAKNMLLNHSSSSENEDEKLKNTIKEIEDSLLRVIKSGRQKKRRIHSNSSSSSSMKNGNEEKNAESESRPNSPVKKNEEGTKNNSLKECDDNSQTTEVCSNSSSSKMVRSKALPSSSSGHNSDSQDTTNDKDIDGLTNIKSLNKVRRRRRNSSTQDSEQSCSTKNSDMPKTSPIDLGAEVEILAVDTSSDEASANEAVEEDLPPVSMTSLNGDSIGHMAKDDLLGESDSSVSNTEKDKPGDESEDENVKAKRRKANTISSDSEAGMSRRKEANKMSDFEDSDEDTSEPIKRSKRKKKGAESDASASASSTDGGKKKRRRIKQVDSDEMSGSDTENEGRNKHGRKNIRKVMGKNQLEEATKKAAREEKERIARIAERQKLYNNLEFDESGKPDEVVLEKVVLDFDPETKKPIIEVDRGLVKKLKPHQANGIKFMWDACFESVKRIKKDKGSGCILAHCMGLGKTLQVVSLTHTLLTHGDLTGVNRVLVVCPLSTVLNWVNEFRMWLKHAETEYEVDVYELSRFKQNSERAFQLQQWTQGGGVCVLGYEMFRNLSADNPKKFKKKMLKNFQEALVDPGPDLVVCDEGHLLKNEKTSLSQSMNRVKTLRRIVLTGTPLQNNLKEYYCMVQFVKPNLLGKYNEYLNRFVNPITNGQYTDSTEHDIRVMKRRSHVLHKMLDGAVQRRDYGVLAPFLPPKHEYVLFITLTEVQIKLYQFYLDNYSRRPQPGKSSGFLFPDFQSLQRIWTHPLVLKYNSERYEIMQQKKREREEEDSEGSLADFIDDDSTPDESTTEESSDDSSDLSDDSRKKAKKKKVTKKGKGNSKASTRRGTRANPIELDDDIKEEVAPEEARNENPTEWWIKLMEEEELEDMRNSHKLLLLFDILRQCEAIGDKLLVFSQSLYSLDLIEHFLGKVDEATQEGRIDEKLGNHVGSWAPGVDYFRLDGSTSCENRSIWCKNFNREDNPRARLFLISTRAGGLGINLVAANRVVIFDVSWNPSHDVQSIFRVYRFGQKKPCYVYRFLAMGTMEEKIYERQVTKQAISKRVIDEQQIDRHYAENDLAELYKFEPHPPTPRPLPPLPKDRLFAEMLKEHEAQIYKYHEHDSLLENKEEETLTEEERKAAWEDFENEKNRPPPAPFPTQWPMHNGMFPSLIQQQQLAYAALAAMLRKDMPNINENQIRDMLPLLYNANPGLVQKMNDIYKYTQSGMMNPMMNPMNVVAGDSGLGGSSGLQYEPPWQRQQQQQQQMRLQQLMQHQNQMGAKYYAGGLGSRDPVAMAMQQQRAREMMLDPTARRPRGRPPMQPRVPPAPGDVVNLDSD